MPTQQQHKFTNSLIHESSPYLLQHAHNPVNWYPWGEEALQKAKDENKLIIVSVGYAACHWCHVMEHESFEDVEVAAYMNEHFVCIKVDREERPDIDQVYMNAVQLITGRGGWPLNCIALPDGRPLYGGTYFPKEQWLSVLSQVYNFVNQNPEKTEEQAQKLVQGIQGSDVVQLNTSVPDFSQNDLNTIWKGWKGAIDLEEGGYTGAPKFPLPVGFNYLLQYAKATESNEVLEAITITLDKMSEGGIYDQIGGGFARYSVDEVWKVPHFEKMLYDNAQLVSLYAQAYQLTKHEPYREVVTQTLEFIERELTHKSGGFYSSLDADSEGEEGKFYVWTRDEIELVLEDEAPLVIDYFNVSAEGNWEHGNNILLRSGNEEALMQKYSLTETELAKAVKVAQQKLLKGREERIRPGLDDKILTAWNGLMLKAYIDAYRALGDESYLESALKNAHFIEREMKTDENRLHRNFKNGKASINGFLDDYAFSISGFIALYQATFDEKWLHEARQLLLYSLDHFYDDESGMFFYTSDEDPALVARKMEVSDNVIPSSNSEMAKNLYVLGQYFYNDNWIARAETMLNNVKDQTLKGYTYYANWDILMSWMVNEPYQVVVVGKDALDMRKELNQHYMPNVFLAGSRGKSDLPPVKDKIEQDKTTIYVCQNRACQLPVHTVKDALEQIR